MENAKTYEYASVYLLDNPYCIDNEYDYFIPLPLREKVKEGAFVTVPFGRGNRKNMAVVKKLSHCPSYSDVKSIFDVCSDRGELSAEMLALCEYMKEQYLCTVGEAVRCVLPSSALGKMTEYYYPVNLSTPSVSAGFSPADLFVYEHICLTGGKSIDSLKAKFGAAVAESAIEKLLSKGYIKKDMLASGKMLDSYVSYYYPATDKDGIRKILSQSSEIKLRSEKQRAVLEIILESDKALTADQIFEKCPASKAQIQALVEKGILKAERRRIWRDEYAQDVGANAESNQENSSFELNDEQSKAYNTIKERLEKDAPSAILLHGVTGSGKTRVIIKAIDKALENGRGVIMLLPEIALTPQTFKMFGSRYGKRIALVHSALSAGERYDAYNRILSGEADLVIGTRSAIFSPVKNLGLVIIDEEHEGSYKSESSPKYHARDIARYRCAKNNALLLLSSATPSIESYTKAMDGKYTLLNLRERFGDAVLPEVKLYDMRNEQRNGNMSPIGSLLAEKLIETVGRNEQAILFLNRRGYNTSVSCKSCGDYITCPRCSISMNYHTSKGNFDRGFLFCHWCGHKQGLPQKCPSCGSEHLVKIGYGTQRIEKELSSFIPDKKILRMDADSTGTKNSLNQLLSEFKEQKADVLLGTQMVTKGHDFPNVTLVGVLLADMSLYMDDYHANERTFSMLTQVIGRAGRAEKKGLAIIQTNNPDNDTIRLACKQDYEAFYASEIRLRKLLVFPPYCDIALITVVCSDEKQTIVGAKRLREELDRLLSVEFKDVETVIFGPFESPVYKVEGKYRMRMVIKCRLNKRTREMFSRLLLEYGSKSKSGASLSIDFNPTGL